jgi:molybdenum cofactor cytidylyltransferase
MGKPKLLLPWRDSTLIESVLATWAATAVTRTVVVVRADDQPLIARCRTHDVDLVLARTPPPDMKASVGLAIEHFQDAFQPNPQDAWLLAPADMPGIAAAHIQQLLNHYHQSETSGIVVPTFQGRRGHPVLFPWRLAAHLGEIPATSGLNWLLEKYGAEELPLDDAAILHDIDTPEDYQKQFPTC